MLHVGCNMFAATGKQWLDTKAVMTILEECFNNFGWPTHIRTDGGPKFRSEFRSFCSLHGITHELSSPYNPESNGLAEAALKSLKSIVTGAKGLQTTEPGLQP